MMILRKAIWMTLLLLVPMLASGQDSFGDDLFASPEVSIRIEGLADSYSAGEEASFQVIYQIPDGLHLTDTFFAVSVPEGSPLELIEVKYPEAIVEGDERMFRGEVSVEVLAAIPDATGDLDLSLLAEYQVCQEGELEVCFPPDETALSASIEITESESGPTDARLADRLGRALDRGSWFAFLIVFLGGVLTSFTPCVYPVIPITITYIGGSSAGNPLKGFVMSLWFVLGIAITYSSLGLIAAASGGVFGQMTQAPAVNAVIAIVILAMSLSMAGLYDIRPPSALISRVGGRRGGFFGPLVMGFATGLIAAPCVGPVLIVLLTWVGQTGSLFLGFWLLFTFALGLGMLFLILGTFSGALSALPGADSWMEDVKHFFYLVLLALALWFLRNMLPAWMLVAAYGLGLVLATSAWGAFHPLPSDAGARRGLGRGVLLLLWVLGAALLIFGGLRGLAPWLLTTTSAPTEQTVGVTEVAPTHSLAEPTWLYDEQEAFRLAAETERPLMMDFWATWCASCKELDHKTYNQPEILALAEDFVPLKMDMSSRSETGKQILKRYAVLGMPTVIFFNSDGEELERFSGFRKAADMKRIMRRVLADAAPITTE